METEQIAIKIVKKLQEAGHIAYFAGGRVRDFLLQLHSDDIDIATDASVESIQELFPKTVPVGIAFGIVIVIEEGHPFEVATFRKEKEYTDGRRPSCIESATPFEDAQRRDFTVNGMFFDPVKQQLFDFVGGQEDLKKGIIRAIGDPHQRFLEDRLRMMRAVRYSVRFRFPIDFDTEQAIRSHAASLLPSVSSERIFQEFEKMSRFSQFDRALEKLYELGLLQVIFPILKDVSLSEMQKRISVIPLFPPSSPVIIELAHLFPEASLEEHLNLCDMLKVSGKERNHIYFFHTAKNLLEMPLSWQKDLEKIDWAKFYADPLSNLYLKIYEAKTPSDQKNNFTNFHRENTLLLAEATERLRSKVPYLSAMDLQKEGVLPGRKMGQLLKEAERIAVNESIQNKEEIILKLKQTKQLD